MNLGVYHSQILEGNSMKLVRTVVTLIGGEVGCSRPRACQRASDKLRTFGPFQVGHGGSIAYTKTHQDLFLRRGVRLAVNCPCRNHEVIPTLSLDRVTAPRAKLKPKLACPHLPV